jgi:polar amino acid transport system substrate-binding protein
VSRTATLAVFLVLVGGAAGAAEPASVLPHLWDPQRQLEKPEIGTARQIRFLTGDDDPPFHFALPDGTLAGFDVDMARAVCGELKLVCTIQVRRRDTLLAALREGSGDVLLAPVAAAARGADLDTTNAYYTTPARFVVAVSNPFANARAATLAGHKVGVATDSPEDVYLQRFFPGVVRVAFAHEAEARAALKAGDVEAVFADAIAASLWLNGSDSDGCCRFLDGAFTESRFFGDGVGMVLRHDDNALRRALDYGLAAIAARGTYSELYLKYFPIGFY